MENNQSNSIGKRDLLILKERIDNPVASSRELSEILESEHGISLSHNRINEIMNELKENGYFEKTFIPSEKLFSQYLFQIQFNYSKFDKYWEECYYALVSDPHIMMFFTTDGAYNWQLIAQFSRDEVAYKWVHDFFKTYGELLGEFMIYDIDKIHCFKTDGEIFDDFFENTDK